MGEPPGETVSSRQECEGRFEQIGRMHPIGEVEEALAVDFDDQCFQ